MGTAVRDSHPTVQDNLTPIPPRYWWLRRIPLLVVVLFIALAGLHWYWGVEANRRWRAALAALEATGEPIHAKDFAVPPVPDEENAAHYLQLAADALVGHPRGVAFQDLIRDLAAGQNSAEVADLLERNAEALRLVHIGAGHPRVCWQANLSGGMLSAKVLGFSRQLQVAQLLHLAAAYDRLNGDAPGAFSRVQDLLAQSAATNRHRALLGHLVSLAISRVATSCIESMAPDLRVVPAGTAQEGVPADQVRGVIRDLLDESELQRGFRDGFCAERALERLTEPLRRNGNRA